MFRNVFCFFAFAVPDVVGQAQFSVWLFSELFDVLTVDSVGEGSTINDEIPKEAVFLFFFFNEFKLKTKTK